MPAPEESRSRAVFVTGATGAIGQAIVGAAIDRGYRVAFTYCHNNVAATDLEARYEGSTIAFECDLCDEDSVRRTIREAQSVVGPLLRVVNGAGVTTPKPLPALTGESWDQVHALNVRAPFLVIRDCLRPMLRSRFGRIVNIGSVAAFSGAAGQAHYGASKAGLVGLTRAVAREYATRGITCNVVAPGYVQTAMTSDLAPDLATILEAAIPMQRSGTPDEIAHCVMFLLDDRSSYVTGATLPVDGGLGMGV